MENPLPFVKSSQELHITQLSQGSNENILHSKLLISNLKVLFDSNFKHQKISTFDIFD